MKRTGYLGVVCSVGACLSLPLVASADTLTVGPDGAFATVQDAVWAGRVLPGSVEIRVQVGTYPENVGVTSTPEGCCEGNLTLSGGWNADFTRRSSDPGLTVIDGRGLDRVFSAVFVGRNSFTLRNLTIRGGYVDADSLVGAAEWGAGLEARVFGSARLILRDVVFSGNRVHLSTLEAAGSGAGAFVWAQESARVVIRACRFERNIIDAAGPTDRGGAGAGLYLIVENRARGGVAQSTFQSNAMLVSGLAQGAGLSAFARDPEARASIFDNRFYDNLLFGSPDPDQAAAGAWVAARGSDGSAQVSFRRNWLVRNTGAVGNQLHLDVASGGYILAGDSVVADGAPGGVRAAGEGPSYLYLTNFTVVDHDGPGVHAEADYAKVSVVNTIAFGNVVDLTVSGDAWERWNLIGRNPRFVNPAAGDYRLQPGSVARDAGWTPPAPLLGPRDAYGRPRVVGASIDTGAAEFQR